MKLQTKILLLGCTILIIAIGFGGVVILNKIDKYFQTIALERNDTTMQEVIKLPALTEALMEPTPLRIEQLNYLTNIIQKSAHVDFIVVIDMNGNRLSHPNPAKIGLHVEGDDTAEVFLGKTYNSAATGTLGSSLRSFKPIHHNGGQIGAIIIGTTIKSINLMASEVYRPIAYFLIFLLSTTIGLTLYLSRNIKKILNNLEPHEIAKILEERNTIFKTVKEGIIAINASGYITLINDEAKRILNLNDKIHGNFFQQNIYPIDDYLQNSRLKEVLDPNTKCDTF